MIDFITSNLNDILTLFACAILAVFAIAKGRWAILKPIALKFMLSAERLMATEEGSKKMEVVYAALWERIPKWVKRFVTEKTLREKLQDWYNIAKNSLGGDTDQPEKTSST